MGGADVDPNSIARPMLDNEPNFGGLGTPHWIGFRDGSARGGAGYSQSKSHENTPGHDRGDAGAKPAASRPGVGHQGCGHRFLRSERTLLTPVTGVSVPSTAYLGCLLRSVAAPGIVTSSRESPGVSPLTQSAHRQMSTPHEEARRDPSPRKWRTRGLGPPLASARRAKSGLARLPLGSSHQLSRDDGRPRHL